MDSIRLIEAYNFDALGSQAIYHAVAETFDSTTPDTIILVSPNKAYICAGYHQDVDREIDLQACKNMGLPVTRRRVGGGAVLLDNGQVFVQWVFNPSSLPYSIEERYVLFVTPLLATYRQLGISAVYRPINDVHVEGRKIGGTGAARIEDAEVLVGSIMFSFDGNTMAKALKVASEKMRDKLVDTLSEYVTSISRELQRTVDRDQVLKDYIGHAQLALGRSIEPGKLSLLEESALEKARQLLSDDKWIFAGPGRKVLGTRIHQDVTVHEGVHKAAGGLLRWIFIEREGIIDDATVEGDFTIEPADVPLRLAESLIGIPFDTGAINHKIEHFFADHKTAMPGLSSADFAAAATAALDKSGE